MRRSKRGRRVTVETDLDRAQYATNATTGPWTVPFYFLANSELAVTYTDAVGVDTLLTLDVDYSVVGAGNEGGGTITTTQAYATGGQLVILRDVAFLQATEYVDGDAFPAKTHERALDRLTMIAQQLREKFGRAITFPASFSGSTEVGDVATRKGKLLGFDAITGALTYITTASGTALALAATLVGSGGAAIVGFLQAGVGAITRPLQTVLREVMVSAMGYGAIGNAPTTDDTVALQALLTYTQSTFTVGVGSQSPANGRCTSFISAGYYKTTAPLTITKKAAVVGDGPAEFSSGTRLVQYTSSTDLFQVTPISQGMSVSFENLSLISNTSGTGHLIHIVAGNGCNSQRYDNLVLGTPQASGLCIEEGDDIMCSRSLWDVSATNAVILGTASASAVVSNASFLLPRFFQVAQAAFLLYNVSGLQILGASVYPSVGTNYLAYFIDGVNTLPYQIASVTIQGGHFSNVRHLAYVKNPIDLKIIGITAMGCKPNTVGFITPVTTATRLSLQNGTISGDFSAQSVYDDSGATVTGGNISGMTFVNTGGGVLPAIKCANTSGVIANNVFIGFTTACVSQQMQTSGNAVNPGLCPAGGVNPNPITFTVAGAKQGDVVKVSPVGVTWPAPVGIEIQGYVSAANTVTVIYRNGTAGAIGVGAHDLAYLVTRGA